MPHFTLPIGPQGPILTVLIGASAPRAAALIQAKQTVPDPIHVYALVDTGAGCTFVDPAIMATLGLSATGQSNVLSATSGAVGEPRQQFDVGLIIPPGTPGQIPLVMQVVPVIATELPAAHGFQALIGRDILSQCVLVYNGELGSYTLAF